MVDKMKRSAAGFTLVELIVVIAILGILAGVAVPVYSGYIDKAQEAADLQLLGAVNTAWAAACAETGQDPTTLSGNVGLTGASGAKRIGTVSASLGGTAVEGFGEAFARFFAGNEDKAFKAIEVLQYVQPDGIFVGYTAGETIEYSIGDKIVRVSVSDLKDYMASSFNTKMSVNDLLERIDNLTSVMNPSGTTFGSIEAGMKSYLNDLGIDYDSLTTEQKSNAAVLYVASVSNDISEEMWNALNGGAINVKNVPAYTAAEYGMMLAYVKSGEAKPFDFNNVTIDPVTMMNYIPEHINEYNGTGLHTTLQIMRASEGFQTYLAKQGASDYAGYMSALNIINENVSSFSGDEIKSLLNGGYIGDDSEIAAILNQVLGN